MGGALLVAYRFHAHKAAPFNFSYFKDEGEEGEESGPSPHSISNPLYGSPDPASGQLNL